MENFLLESKMEKRIGRRFWVLKKWEKNIFAATICQSALLAPAYLVFH